MARRAAIRLTQAKEAWISWLEPKEDPNLGIIREQRGGGTQIRRRVAEMVKVCGKREAKGPLYRHSGRAQKRKEAAAAAWRFATAAVGGAAGRN